jgi:CRP/FNR family transcriptional regulator, nitrogen fixation regulation protein
MQALRQIEVQTPRQSTETRPFAKPVSGHGTLAETLSLMGATLSFARNNEIYGEDEPADYIYMVRSGAVRTYKLLSDGRRQIGGFHLAGDVFGLEAGSTHYFTAEAISNSQVVMVKRSAVEALAARDGDVAREILKFTARDLDLARSHLMLLGRKNALERVATFLLEMAERADADAVVDLPMSRQDIADYLGLTIETVSRTLTQLESNAAIELPTCRRHILLRNRSILRRLNA